MPSYQIHSVVASNPWRGNDGKQMLTHVLNLIGPGGSQHGNVELIQLQQTAAPVPGTTIEGDIVQGNRGQRLKKAAPAGGGGGGGGRGGGGMTPERQAAITRQHSQDMAVRVLAMIGAPAEPEAVQAQVRSWADWFDADVARVAAAAKAAPGAAGGQAPAQQAPAQQAQPGFGAAPAQGFGAAGADDDIPF